MARVVVLGGGVSGHTAAAFLKRWLGKQHQVTVVTPNSQWNWIPSNIWVGVGKMKRESVLFDLAPVYQKVGIDYQQAKALSIHPEGDSSDSGAFVEVEYTGQGKIGERARLPYDYLVNATGPKLKFEATEGLGPGGFSESVCTADHAAHSAAQMRRLIDEMKQGQRKTFVIGTGHGTCTCQGAAFEYLFNIDYVLREQKVRDQAELVWLTNEYELGDFGMGGAHIKEGGFITNTKIFTESLMAERGIKWITRAHVQRVTETEIFFEKLDGSSGSIAYDFTMLIPPFSGVGLKAYDKSGADITDKVFAPNGFMRVDADYSGKPYEQWSAEDWPKTYQSPSYPNMFACGIAFAPPHAISKPMKSPNGTPISPTPPRTGMPSAMIGKSVARNIVAMIKGKAKSPEHTSSMARIGAACVASTGSSIVKGSAVSMTVFPIVPDYQKYPKYGRDLSLTFGEIGLAGHWIKYILHRMFLYKAKLKPFWYLIPE
ncbi:MAG: FAD-dependent oxidoreductase [Planctomycetales bacterium]|nr:FAD-dependent oxidoreductase [Planctomycetales bacterium]